MNTKKVCTLIAVVLTMAMLLAACGGTAEPAATPTTEATAPAATEPPAPTETEAVVDDQAAADAVAALIDATGFLGADRLPFTWQKLLGVALMVGGVLLMKWKTS